MEPGAPGRAAEDAADRGRWDRRGGNIHIYAADRGVWGQRGSNIPFFADWQERAREGWKRTFFKNLLITP